MISANKMSFTRKFISGEIQAKIWGAISGTAATAIAAITLSSLSLYEYGVFQLILALYGIAGEIPSLGTSFVSVDLLRFVGEGNKRAAKKLFFESYGVQGFISVIIAGVFFFGSSFFVPTYGTEFTVVGKILACLVLANALAMTLKAIHKLNLQIGVMASRRTVQKILQLAFLGYFVLFAEVDLQIVLWSMVVGLAGSSVFSRLPPGGHISLGALWCSLGAQYYGRTFVIMANGRYGLGWPDGRQAISSHGLLSLLSALRRWLSSGLPRR